MENNLLFEVLRILTPQEIAELATSSESQEKLSLTDMMGERFLLKASEVEPETAAKILPFTENQEKSVPQEATENIDREAPEQEYEEEEAEEESEVGKSISRLSDMFKVEEVIVEEKVDTIKFILEEKERSKKSSRTLKGKEVLKLYQSNAAVSVEQEKKNKKNLSKSTHSGVLINKKQA